MELLVNQPRFSFQRTYRNSTSVFGPVWQGIAAPSPPPPASWRPAESHPDQPEYADFCLLYRMKIQRRSGRSRQSPHCHRQCRQLPASRSSPGPGARSYRHTRLPAPPAARPPVARAAGAGRPLQLRPAPPLPAMPGVAGRVGIGNGNWLSLHRRVRHWQSTGRQHILNCGNELRQKIRSAECVAASTAYCRDRV